MQTPESERQSEENSIDSGVEDPLYRCRGEFGSSSGSFSSLVEAVSDSTESLHACAADLVNRLQDFKGKYRFSPLNLIRGKLPRLGRIRGTEFDASCAGYRKSRRSAL